MTRAPVIKPPSTADGSGEPTSVQEPPPLDRQRARDVGTALSPEASQPLHPFDTSSQEMRDAVERLVRVAATDSPITLLGEPGTGKRSLGKATHDLSQYASGPFVAVACRGVSAKALEEALFGSSTAKSPARDQQNALERARGGSLYIAQIEELPLALQARLVSVLADIRAHRFENRGRQEGDVRMIGASSENLPLRVRQGRYLNELYERLAATMVRVPPLRARLDDLPFLTRQVLDELGRRDVVVSASAFELLRAYAWPGNLSELRSVLGLALAYGEAPELEVSHFRDLLRTKHDMRSERLVLTGHTLEELERMAIQQTLVQTRGVKARAARALGIAVSTLYEKLKKYELEH